MNEAADPDTGELALSKPERLALCERRIVAGLSDAWDAWREIDTDCLYETISSSCQSESWK